MIGMQAGRSFMSIQQLVASHRRLRDHGYVRATGSEVLATISKYITTDFL
jgi:septum formation topological specificity factor MinE